MFGIGFFELLVIAIVALVFVGPKKLPDFMKTAGKFFVQMRRTANDVRGTFDQVVRDAETEIRKEEAEAMKALLAKDVSPQPKLSTAEKFAADNGHLDQIQPDQAKPYMPPTVTETPPAVAENPGETPKAT